MSVSSRNDTLPPSSSSIHSSSKIRLFTVPFLSDRMIYFARAFIHVHAAYDDETCGVQSYSFCCPGTDAPDRLHRNNDQGIPQVFKEGIL